MTRPEASASPLPDRWDRLALALVPFGAVMLACVSTSVRALTEGQPDVLLYFRNAGQLAAGVPPYSGFRLEYPPLALLPMALPYVAWPPGSPTLLDYEWMFAFQNALLATLVAGLLAWLAGRPGSIVTPFRVLLVWALLAVIEAPVLAWRFDIAAVALAVGGVALVVARRPALGGGVLALGALVKVFPLALVPVLLGWAVARGERSAAIRLVAGFALTGVVVAGVVVAALGLEPIRQFISYQQERLVQIESVMASALLLIHVFTGAALTVGYGYQSVQVAGPGTDLFLAIQNVLMVVAVGAVGVLGFLRFRAERQAHGSVATATLAAYLLAAVLAVLVTNKVFSAQYLLWVLPFGCLLPRRQAAVFVAVAVLSIVVFPLAYKELIDLEVPAILTLVTRNLLLVGLLGWALVRYRPMGLRAQVRVGHRAPVGLIVGGPATGGTSVSAAGPTGSSPQPASPARVVSHRELAGMPLGGAALALDDPPGEAYAPDSPRTS